MVTLFGFFFLNNKNALNTVCLLYSILYYNIGRILKECNFLHVAFLYVDISIFKGQ